ncbi:cyclophilin-like fold protein [Lactobacillus sp.]|uniref:cyclophilin-like fold protein n=1 Tax=Lactobacillus sp. TaxID=1591 RepID=UPI003F05A8F2
MRVSITAGKHTVYAKLYDNAAARQLYDKLPATLTMLNLYGREMCCRMGAGSLPATEAVVTGYKIGDISYWPPAGSLVILYEQNGEVFNQQPIGRTEDDISFFAGMPDTDVIWKKA